MEDARALAKLRARRELIGRVRQRGVAGFSLQIVARIGLTAGKIELECRGEVGAVQICL